MTATGKVDCAGDDVCPAELAGVEVGDVIRLADNVRLSSNADLQQVIADSGGRDVTLSLTRGSAELTACLHPVYSESAKTWRGGMWVRDSIAGIGTMTYINKETGEFAGLGHPVCDTDTGEIIPIQSGEAVPVEITGARKGVTGRAGELRVRAAVRICCEHACRRRGGIPSRLPTGHHHGRGAGLRDCERLCPAEIRG